jgi:hypothetical protein
MAARFDRNLAAAVRAADAELTLPAIGRQRHYRAVQVIEQCMYALWQRVYAGYLRSIWEVV